MKKSALFLILMGLAVWGATLPPAFAKPRTVKYNASAGRRSDLPQWERQLLSHIQYPEVLQQGNHEGIVVVRFQVNQESRVAKLEVLTANEQLNQDLTRQLTGKKVRMPQSYVPETHVVRLHFRLTE